VELVELHDLWDMVINVSISTGKVGMSVLTKGLAMDFVREGRTEMAITSIWPAVVCLAYSIAIPP
jgi:hypothetical protein